VKTSYWANFAVAVAFFFQLGQTAAADSVEQLRASGARVVADTRTGNTRFVGFDAQAVGKQPAASVLQQLPAEAAAAQHLSRHAGLFGLRNAASETRTIKHRVGKDGRAMTRYQQQHQGIPVIAGELIVNQTAQRQLTSISGKISSQLTLDTTPVITADEAQAIARQAMAKWYQLPADEFVAPEPTLSIYDSRLMSPHSDPVALVWRLNVTTKSLRPINEFMAVNAKTGGITLHFNQVPHAKNRLTYDAANNFVLPGTLVCTEANPTCAGGIEDAIYAHRYAGTTYDFYAANFGRDGIDGAGMPMKSTVRHCEKGEACPYQNAFWNGIQMVYGQGFAKGEDIVAHELTHGVTDYESQLYYYYQSGAINESLSDVFGELIQQSNPSGTMTRATKWLVGEDLSTGVLRSMSNPPAYGDPDRMTSPNYYTAAGDDGGVHINSGVNNKAAYLMVDGGNFNGRTVIGIGLTKAAKIYYRVQAALLTSGSDYSDLHNALYQACQDLIGTAGIGIADCLSVQNATLAVEMNLAPSAGFNPEAAMCPVGQSVSGSIFSDNLESGVRNWSFTHSVGTQDWAGMTGYASSGNYSLYGVDLDVTSDLSASLARGVTLSANAHLWFKHAFDFEASSGSYYDGGVLEYSSNGGSTWNDAGSLYAQGQNYGGVLGSGGGNPLEGRSAFVAESHGYVSSRYNLSALAGQTVRFRWRIGSDVFVGARGWYVDDVRVQVCAADAVIAPAAPSSRLVNLSTRGQVQVGDNVMIGGFVIGGSSAKKVLIRAVGPTLANYGVTGVLANPMLQLYAGQANIASNDNWQDANASAIQATGLAPANVLEAAILTTLTPGAYTAMVSGAGGGTGVGMVEVYEIDHPEIPLINMSTRGQVQTGNNVMIGGFIIQGDSSKTVLIRAVGPNLANYGVTGVLANPMLQLYSGQTIIASNDNWQDANASAIQATGLAPASVLESAILITLPPGAYTAIVSGAGGGTGVGIIEVFTQ